MSLLHCLRHCESQVESRYEHLAKMKMEHHLLIQCTHQYTHPTLDLTQPQRERERGHYCIRVYLSFIHHKNPKIICNPEAIYKSWLDTEVSFEDPESKYWKSIEINRQQTYKDQVCMLGGWEVTLVYDNSLSIHRQRGWCTPIMPHKLIT